MFRCRVLQEWQHGIQHHLLHKAVVDVVNQVVDLPQLFAVPVREWELRICVPPLHDRARVDAILPQRVRYVEFAKHLQRIHIASRWRSESPFYMQFLAGTWNMHRHGAS